MTCEELRNYILETYTASADFPWMRYPDYEVFRHPENQKWFALVMTVPSSVFSASTNSPGPITIINVKCDPILSGSLRQEPGIHPAYHMNKDQWISVEIEVVPEEKLKMLVDMSFTATTKQACQSNKRKYPEDLLSDMVWIYMTLDEEKERKYGEEWLEKARRRHKAAKNINTADAALADQLLSRIKQPNQDIVRKYYKENMTLDAISKEYGISRSRVRQQRNKGLRLIQSRWMNHGCPTRIEEYKETVKKREAEITLESDISVLQPSIRVYNCLYRDQRNTVADLLTVENPGSIPGIGTVSCAEIKMLQEKARKILRENGK